jgi:radical SAM superfamily enzyme YgiQ (UPF0313 family)
MSLGILKVGAVLEQAGYEVDHLDLSGVQNAETVARDYLRSYLTSQPDCRDLVFAITATTPQIPAAIRIRNVLQGKSILGGPHATLLSAAAKRGNARAIEALGHLLDSFDTVVAGDGERAIFRAIKEYGLIDADDPRSDLWAPNNFFSPWPARHLVDVDSYHYEVDGERALSLICQLGCPFESITSDSFIFDSNGFETIAELASRVTSVSLCVNTDAVVQPISESIAAKDGRKTASYFIQESEREVYEVRHKFGIPLKGTPEHLILTVDADSLIWRSISELKPGDWIACRFPEVSDTYQLLTTKAQLRTVPPGGFHSREIRIPSVMTEELAWLTGFMLGDGCLPMDGRPSIHVCVTQPVKDRLTKTFRTLFDCELRIYSTDVTENMQHGWVHSRAVYEFFVQTLAIDPRCKLRVPTVIRKSPRSVIAAFLEGLWDADGYEAGHQSYLTTVDEEFARQVSMLLLMNRKIPFIHEAGKYFRVGTAVGERIPVDRSLYKSPKSFRWYWRTKKSANRTGVRRRTLRESCLSHPLDIDGIFYSQVKSTLPAGREVVYDLTVPDGENFVANGIIVHNCGFCGGRLSPMLRRTRPRQHSIDIIAEMVHLYDCYGVKGMMLLDDELNVNKGIVPLMQAIRSTGIDWRLRGFVKAELFTEEQAEAMYCAGFRWLLCGFESAHPKILLNINKKATLRDNTNMLRIAHAHGLKVKALMSFGHPGESEQTILATRDWLLEEKPDDFDCTVITEYPGTPYWDQSVCIEEPVYKYEFHGEVLYSRNIDFSQEAAYYKGVPGDYHAFVWTDYISSERLVAMRDAVEDEVRTKLRIPYPTAPGALFFEHSMGMNLPSNILRGTNGKRDHACV